MRERDRFSARGHRTFYTGIVLLLLLTGCMSRNHMEVLDLPDDRWPAGQAVVFDYHPADTANNRQQIELIVRHRNDFPYDHLTLEIKGVTADRRYWTDTVYLPLKAQGNWIGKRYSNHYDLSLLYREGIRYDDTRRRSVSIRQLNTPDTLRGIAAIGIIASGSAY